MGSTCFLKSAFSQALRQKLSAWAAANNHLLRNSASPHAGPCTRTQQFELCAGDVVSMSISPLGQRLADGATTDIFCTSAAGGLWFFWSSRRVLMGIMVHVCFPHLRAPI